jgi:hypothetical protein
MADFTQVSSYIGGGPTFRTRPHEITSYKILIGLNHFFRCCVQGAWSRASATVSSIFFCSSL